MKKIAIVGIGGRTGTMFAFELKNSTEVIGVGRKEETEKIKKGKIFIQRDNENSVAFSGEVIAGEEFDEKLKPDFIFLCVKNPVSIAVNYYYRKISKEGKIPTLVLSQNGVSAIDEAKKELNKIFGKKTDEIQIIRISLFNPISSERSDDTVNISYFSPIRLAFGVASGPKDTNEIKEILEKAHIGTEKISHQDVRNMEFSKLFTNLIGMASAARGLTIGEGFKDREVFEEEMGALKEYIRVVKKSGGKFLNFKRYPIKTFTSLIDYLPITFLKIFQKRIAKMITKGRKGKEKGNIDEIEYYNGVVVKLGKELKVDTPVNQKIYNQILEKL